MSTEMNELSLAAPLKAPAVPIRGALARSVLAVAALDLKRLLLSRRAVPLLVLGWVPVMLAGLVATLAPEDMTPGRYAHAFAGMFRYLVLPGTLFFGVATALTGLIRGEILDKSLHFVLLAPIRREVVIAGKYLAGFGATALVFGASTGLSHAIFLSGAGAAGRQQLASPEGLATLASYVLVSVLACAAYGGLFLALGLWGKNPMVPAILVWGLERLSVVFPKVLRWWLPIHHLDSLLPVHLVDSPFALIVEPSPWWAAVPMLLTFGVAFAAVAAVLSRRLEVHYGVE